MAQAKDSPKHRFINKALVGGLGFSDAHNLIIYISGQDAEASKVVENNIPEIESVLHSHHQFELFHVPDYIQKCIRTHQFSYYFPDEKAIPQPIKMKDIYLDLWKKFVPKKDLPKAGAFLSATYNGRLIYYPVDTDDISTLEATLGIYCDYVSDYNYHNYCYTSRFGGIYDNPYSPPEDENADRNFDRMVRVLSDEIRERVEKLRVYGVSEMVIKSLFQKEQKLSRLVITDDFRIVLPDYDNMEIKLEPLPKAVFILFLRHPRGIMFKYLPDYREEFLAIYLKVTNRKASDLVNESVNKVLDPTKNSINEKCSRIREAFISRFDDGLAYKYYITGTSGTKKKIKLDRSLVDLGPMKALTEEMKALAEENIDDDDD